MTTLDKIRQWGEDRNLIKGTTAEKQCLKTMEELGELSSAILKNDMDGIIDGIGDTVVTLTLIAAQYGIKIEDCIDAAYDEIKDRKGKMINGAFVKEGDLKDE